MGTTLYNTDIKTVPNRPELSALDAGDFYLVYDTSTGKISKISKTNAHAELVASIGANADDILLRESLSNKKSTLSENSEIYYPNQKAVNDGLSTKTSKSQIAYYAESTTPADVGWIPNTLASGAIIERGDNSNGSYVKFADGTMICTGTITSSTVWNNTAFGFRYSGQVEASLPATYSKAPIAVIEPRDATLSTRSAWVAYVDTTVSSIVDFTLSSTSGSSAIEERPFRYVTIGSWK